MSSPEVCGPARGLTRIRLQLAIYFCLHRGSLPENTAGRQALFQGDEHITALLKSPACSCVSITLPGRVVTRIAPWESNCLLEVVLGLWRGEQPFLTVLFG